MSRLPDPVIPVLLLPALLLAACSPQSRPVEIPFEVRYGDAPLDCDGVVDGIRLTDLRLFVHDFRLLTADGAEHAVELPDRPPWQGRGVVLLDFENAAAACRNGSPALNDTVHGLVAPAAGYAGLSFRIGVPEALNHVDPLTAPPPLNSSTMHWQWLTGYKFLRAGIAAEDDGFWIHLGSTRCEGTASNPQGCANANRVEAKLPEFTPGASVVVLDLAALAGTVDLEDGEHSDCSSGPAEAACEAPFRALGLDFSSGEAAGTPALVRVTNIE